MEADWRFLQRQAITHHPMKVVVVVAVFPVFFASVSIIVSHFLDENLAKKPLSTQKFTENLKNWVPRSCGGSKCEKNEKNGKKLEEIDNLCLFYLLSDKK